jgi:hypothetical protein
LLSSCLVGNDVVESPTRSRWYTALGAMWCVFAFRFYFPVTTVKSFKPVVFNADVHDLITYHGRPHLVGIMVRIDPIEVWSPSSWSWRSPCFATTSMRFSWAYLTALKYSVQTHVGTVLLRRSV